MRFNGTTIPTHRDETYDTSEVSRYPASSSGDIEVEALDVIENGTYIAPEGKAYSPVKVDVSGEGSSDFSTAEVTCNDMSAVKGCFISSLPISGESMIDASYYRGRFGNQLILYKGRAVIEVDETVVSTSGSIEDIGSRAYIVTGDCTITTGGGDDPVY